MKSKKKQIFNEYFRKELIIMNNFEKYNKLHTEIMKRLEAGEITTEQAKEVNDLAFEKYVTEGVVDLSLKNTNKKYNGVDILIVGSNEEGSMDHVENDLKILNKKSLDTLLKEKFVPWLKGTQYKDMDDDKIIKGIKLYEVTYSYHKFAKQYSPINKECYLGEFELCFESSNEYTKSILEAAQMNIIIYGNKIVSMKCHDI